MKHPRFHFIKCISPHWIREMCVTPRPPTLFYSQSIFFPSLSHLVSSTPHRQLFEWQKSPSVRTICFELINNTYIDWLALCLPVSCRFHYRQIPLTCYGWWRNKISESINTNTWFLPVEPICKLFCSVHFCCQSAWWRHFGQLLSSQLPRSCSRQTAASVDETPDAGWSWFGLNR